MQSSSVDFFDDRDDSDLLTHARNGDTRCADVLWVRVRPSVLAVARGIAGNKHDADDLASEAMAKVFAAIANGQGPTDSILPYLYTTMRNLHISTLRRQARVGAPIALDEQRVLNLVTVEPDAIESELVTRAFKNLPDRWRYVLWAGLVEGRPGGEIADNLGIKPAAVHALKSRALEGLRQQYLSEHALLSEEQECAEVHRVLASIARGRSRRSTDLNQVWRHLRGCEHCAEGYREITAINSRIGALLAPAAASLIGFIPNPHTLSAIGVLRLPEAAGKLVAAAGVAGIIGIAGAVLTFDQHHDPAVPGTAPAAVVSVTPERGATLRPVSTPPRSAPAVVRAARGTVPACSALDVPQAGLLTDLAFGSAVAGVPAHPLVGEVADAVQQVCTPPADLSVATKRADSAATIADLASADAVPDLDPLVLPAPKLPIDPQQLTDDLGLGLLEN